MEHTNCQKIKAVLYEIRKNKSAYDLKVGQLEDGTTYRTKKIRGNLGADVTYDGDLACEEVDHCICIEQIKINLRRRGRELCSIAASGDLDAEPTFLAVMTPHWNKNRQGIVTESLDQNQSMSIYHTPAVNADDFVNGICQAITESKAKLVAVDKLRQLNLAQRRTQLQTREM